MGPFQWYEPEDARAACRFLGDRAPHARCVAGGTDLVIQLNQGRLAPRHVVNLQGLGELAGIRHDGTALSIGAMTTVQALERSPLVRDRAPVLWRAARTIASPGIRSMATVGGNLCNASPSADLAPPLLALDADVRIVGVSGERWLPLAEFFVGPGRTVLAADELLAEIRVPDGDPDARGVFVKLPAKTRNDIALVSVAALVRLEPDSRGIAWARLALGAVAPTPLRAPAAEALLNGREASPAALAGAAAAAADAARPISDVRGSAAYRREMVRELTRQALGQATNAG